MGFPGVSLPTYSADFFSWVLKISFGGCETHGSFHRQERVRVSAGQPGELMLARPSEKMSQPNEPAKTRVYRSFFSIEATIRRIYWKELRLRVHSPFYLNDSGFPPAGGASSCWRAPAKTRVYRGFFSVKSTMRLRRQSLARAPVNFAVHTASSPA